MNWQSTLWLVLMVLVIGCVVPRVHAYADSSELRYDLPVYNVYDPLAGRNVPIVDYSYAELANMISDASFRQWNDMTKVCASIGTLYGVEPASCGGAVSVPVATYPVFVATPVVAHATVQFTILPSRPLPVVYHRVGMLRVDPVYPPWSPAYDPYY